MKTSVTKKVANERQVISMIMGAAFIFLAAGSIAFAKEGKVRPEGAQGGGHHMNPPGAAGGPGRGPAFNNRPGPADGKGMSSGYQHEMKQNRRDNDNNPPGPRGGQGSNWEKNDFKRRDNDNNPPGPRGGQGSNWEKNDYKRRDNDNNPPGPRGGQGSNWEKNDYKNGRENSKEFLENHPKLADKLDKNDDGKVDRTERRAGYEHMKEKSGYDKDNNPPGPKGGQGTNWENRPGQQGGQGASPDFKRERPGQRLENLKEHRAKMAEKGASAEELAKIDEKIQGIQTKIDEYKSKNTAETASTTGQ